MIIKMKNDNDRYSGDHLGYMNGQEYRIPCFSQVSGRFTHTTVENTKNDDIGISHHIVLMSL